MGVEMNLGQSDHQAQGVTAVLSNRINAYETIRSSLQTFIGTSNLQGHAYQSAKDYSSQVLIPLLKGCILLDEAIREACAKLPSEYRSRVDVISLKESNLNDNIDRAQSMINSYQNLIDWEYCREEPDYHYISNLRGLRNSYQELHVELTLKRDKLVAFSGSSPSLFSDIHSLLEAVQQGLRQASLSWDSKTGTFKISDEVGMAWADGLNRPWQHRATTRAQDLIKRVEKGEDLNSDELNELGRYLVDNPKSKLYDKGMSAFLKASKLEVVGVDGLVAFLEANVVPTASEEFLTNLLEKIDDSFPNLSNYFKVYAEKSNQTFNNIKFSVYYDGKGYGRAVSNSLWKSGIKSMAVSGPSLPIGNLVDFMGNPITQEITGLGTAFMALDFLGNLKEENAGRAFMHTVATTAMTTIGVQVLSSSLLYSSIGTGAIASSTSVVTGFMLAHPLGWAVLAGIGVGLATNWAYENNVLGVKDIVNEMGDNLNTHFENIGNSIQSSWETIELVFGGRNGA